jgi:hypothetical protein
MDAVYQVFPAGGLDQSIVLAVLIGVWVTLLFTETLGWVFVGLVVPGYLASVLVVQPTAAAIIVAEGLATYVLARGLAYGLAPTRVWQPFFGRDRFFLIVVASVLIRQHDQLWLLPALSTWLEDQVGAPLPPVREFYSIGLVLVPLTANLLWKPGVLRGMTQLGVVTGVTYLVLTRVLLTFTNLSLSSFELLYEDTAVDFLGNAKAYVLLLTTAAVAARFNLRYGWDFGGILVPALLGLLWFTPGELVITLAEALLIWGVVVALLRYTPLGRFNLEGARKVALVFTVSVALKWTLSLAVATVLVGVRPRDLFGFGYLLSSLLALRMLARKSARKVLLPTLVTALSGWALGSLVGFVLDLLAPVTGTPPEGPEVASQRLLRTPLGALALARVQAELAVPEGAALPMGVRVAHAQAWTALAEWSEAAQVDGRAVEAALREADMVLVPLRAEDGPRPSFAALGAERGGARGQGLGVLWPGASGPVIGVPRPVAEGPAAEAAAVLARSLDARAVVVAERDEGPRMAGDDRYARALAELAPEGYLELRADTRAGLGEPVLHVERALPESLDLKALGRAPRLEWSAPPGLRGEAWGRGGRLVLRVHPRDLVRLLAEEVGGRPVVAALLPWLGARERGPSLRPLAPSGPPSGAELVFLERRVAAPLIAGVEGDGLAVARRMAGLVDHEIWDIERCGPAGPCRALGEAWRATATGWTTMVVAAGEPGLVVEAPQIHEERGTGRLAAELWLAARGKTLLLGGGAPVLGPHAPVQALHQAALAGGASLLLQVRGQRAQRQPQGDLVIGLGQPVLDARPLPPGLEDMFAPGGPLAWVSSRRLADGSPELAGLAGAGNVQLEFASEVAGVPSAVLWFPPALRRAYAPHDPCAELARLEQIGVGGDGCRPIDEISARARRGAGGGGGRAIDFAEALRRVERYAENGDLHLLLGVVAGGHALRAGLGQTSGRGFIVLEGRRAPPAAAVAPRGRGAARRGRPKASEGAGALGHAKVSEGAGALGHTKVSEGAGALGHDKVSEGAGALGNVDMSVETGDEAPPQRALVWLGPALGGRATASDEAGARALLFRRGRSVVIGGEETR